MRYTLEHRYPVCFILPLEKALSGPFIGPRGGKWADPKLTIHWTGTLERRKQKELRAGREKKLRGSGVRAWIAHYKYEGYRTSGDFRLKKGDVGTGEPPVYRQDRAQLHDAIIEKFISDSKGNRIEPPKAGEQKVAIIMMGGPASGKTSTVKHLLGLQVDETFGDKGFALVNPDDVKEALPEYNEGLKMNAKDAAAITHEESSDVASMVYSQAINTGVNIVIDGTGRDAVKHAKKVQNLQDHGYHVKLVMADLGIEEARLRSKERAERSGRFVPLKEVLEPAHRMIPGNFEKVARASQEFYLFDTRHGPPPDLMWSGGDGRADEKKDPMFVAGFEMRGKRLQAQEARRQTMRKSDDATPSLTYDQILENLERSKHAKYEDTTVYYPGAGRNGNGAYDLNAADDIEFQHWKSVKK